MVRHRCRLDARDSWPAGRHGRPELGGVEAAARGRGDLEARPAHGRGRLPRLNAVGGAGAPPHCRTWGCDHRRGPQVAPVFSRARGERDEPLPSLSPARDSRRGRLTVARLAWRPPSRPPGRLRRPRATLHRPPCGPRARAPILTSRAALGASRPACTSRPAAHPSTPAPAARRRRCQVSSARGPGAFRRATAAGPRGWGPRFACIFPPRVDARLDLLPHACFPAFPPGT